MNDIETRLRVTLEEVASTTVAENRIHDLASYPTPRTATWSGLRVALASFVVLAVAVGLPALLRGPSEPQPAADSSELDAPLASSLSPTVTLPDTFDVFDEPPPTVADDHPTEWYRLAPDLHVAWYRDVSSDANPSMVCFRTPVEASCGEDMLGPGSPEIVPTGGGQTLVIVIPDGSETPQTLTLELSDGTQASAPMEWDDGIGWGLARFELRPDLTIVDTIFGG